MINIGCGIDISIQELEEFIVEGVGYDGRLVFDISRPDGTYRKLLDISKLSELGWRASINLEDGIRKTIEEFKELL